MTHDLISGSGDVDLLVVGLSLGAWAFLDAKGLLRFLFRMGGWAPWRPREMPTISGSWIAFLKWEGGLMVAICVLVLAAHFLRL